MNDFMLFFPVLALDWDIYAVIHLSFYKELFCSESLQVLILYLKCNYDIPNPRCIIFS